MRSQFVHQLLRNGPNEGPVSRPYLFVAFGCFLSATPSICFAERLPPGPHPVVGQKVDALLPHHVDARRLGQTPERRKSGMRVIAIEERG